MYIEHLECFGTAAIKNPYNVSCIDSCRNFRSYSGIAKYLWVYRNDVKQSVYSEGPQNFDEVVNGVHLFWNYSIYDLSRTMHFPFPAVIKSCYLIQLSVKTRNSFYNLFLNGSFSRLLWEIVWIPDALLLSECSNNFLALFRYKMCKTGTARPK